jgi:hypothetical protein
MASLLCMFQMPLMMAVERRKHVRGKIIRIHALYWEVAAFFKIKYVHAARNI